MKELPEFARVLELYRADRNLPQFGETDFERMLLLFPAFIVSQADGHIDTAEIMQIHQLMDHIQSLIPGESQVDYKAEVRYMMWNLNIWKPIFLPLLKSYLEIKPFANEVVDIMVAAASSSTGNILSNIRFKTLNPATQTPMTHEESEQITFISEEEQQSILQLIRELNLGQHEGILDRVHHIFNY